MSFIDCQRAIYFFQPSVAVMPKKKNFWRTVNKTKLQPEQGRVICVLLIFLWLLPAYDRTGTIVGLDLQNYLLGDRSLCPTFCFQACCKKHYTQPSKQTNQPDNKHTEHLFKKWGTLNVENMDLLQSLYVEISFIHFLLTVCGTIFARPVIMETKSMLFLNI